jgi:hypothetical protein
MRAKRTKETSHPVPEITAGDRTLLTDAFKTGLIVAWRLDPARGYRLTLNDQQDRYVEIAQLSSYLDGLRRGLA